MKRLNRTFLLLALAGASAIAAATAGGLMDAVVYKPTVQVRGTPLMTAATVATLQKNQPVKVAGQKGMWFQLAAPAGYVRVTDLRMAYQGKSNPATSVQAVFGGKAGKGRVTETASVRGLNESSLKSASYNAAQIAKMNGYRATAAQGSAWARSQGLPDTTVAYPEELPEARAKSGGATQKEKRRGIGMLGGLLGGMLGEAGSTAAEGAEVSQGKSEEELLKEELEIGPRIAGQILGAFPLMYDDEAQRKVNLIGRWLASHTARPDLPWTFGIIDSPEVNGFAAPGGYILITRGLYEMAASDEELAAALAHELSHAVQRDHYNVLHKHEKRSFWTDAAASQVGGVAGIVANLSAGLIASTMMSALDKGAEYRSDRAAEIYLARSGYNPMAIYAILQKLSALGTESPQTKQWFTTHPSLEQRLDAIDKGQYAGVSQYTDRETRSNQ